jgi:hypothetical protein
MRCGDQGRRKEMREGEREKGPVDTATAKNKTKQQKKSPWETSLRKRRRSE